MSFESVSRKGYEIAEAKQQPSINQSMSALRQARIQINRALQDVYNKYLSDISGDDGAYWAEMVKHGRYGKLETEITKIYRDQNKTVRNTITAGLVVAMLENYGRQSYVDAWIAEGAKPRPINKELVKYATTGSEKSFRIIKKLGDRFSNIWGNPSLYSNQAGTVTKLVQNYAQADVNRILQTVENGLKNGRPYREVANEIKEIIGDYTRLKTKEISSGSMARALRIARTEGQRILNAGSLAEMYQLRAQGFDVKKMWNATLDERTRATHRSLDDTVIQLEELFISPSGSKGPAPGQMDRAAENINCRCSLVSIIEDEKPTIRSARNPESGKTEIISYKGYREWEAEL